MRVGDLVKDKAGPRLVCGSGIYPRAVVMSVKPFIMVSESADMLWTQQKKEHFRPIGKAGFWTILRCAKRLTWKQRYKLLGDL